MEKNDYLKEKTSAYRTALWIEFSGNPIYLLSHVNQVRLDGFK